MRLNDKYTIWFSIMCLSVLSLGILTVYQVGISTNRSAAVKQLQSLNRRVAGHLDASGLSFPLPENCSVRELSAQQADTGIIIVRDSFQWVPDLLIKTSALNVSSCYPVRGKRYVITSFLPVTRTGSDYLYPLARVVVWLLLFFSVLVVFFSKVISWYILSPFHATLRSIRQFENDHDFHFHPELTSTAEFRFLNSALLKMTDRVRDDIEYLREFSKFNIHELKTPVAIVGVKLRMMVQNPLEQRQKALVSEMELQLKKLKRIADSLELLAALRSGAYQQRGNLNFSNRLNDALENLQDWIDDEGIVVRKEIEPDVWLLFHEDLVDRLLPNIFSNTIKHNFYQGTIEVKLDEWGLLVRNTCRTLPPAEKSPEAMPTSGLKILKAICDVSDLTLTHGADAEAGWYFTAIRFNGKAVAG